MPNETSELVVHGTVRSAFGRPVPGLTVRAFDKDLRSQSELGSNTPPETDREGRYRIPYTRDQFARAEKDDADLIVRVYDGQSVELVSSSIVFNAAQDQTVDLVLPAKARSEWEDLEDELAPLLGDVVPWELTDEDLGFLEGETRRSEEQLGRYRKAHRSAAAAMDMLASLAPANREYLLPASVFYAFARGSLPALSEGLFRTRFSELVRVLDDAIAQGIVPAALDAAETRPDLDRRLEEHVVHARRSADGLSGFLETIPGSTLSGSERRRVLSLEAKYDGPAGEFWTALTDPGGAALTAAQAKEVRTTVELAALTQGRGSLVQKLQQELWPAPDPSRLATKNVDAWLELIEDRDIRGEATEESRRALARTMVHAVERAYPTPSFAAQLQSEGEEGLVRTFLSDHPRFRFESTDVDSIRFGDDERESEERIRSWQRSFLLVPGEDRLEAVRALRTEGLSSAREVVDLGYEPFVETMSATLGEQRCKQIYDNAWNRAMTTFMLAMEAADHALGPHIAAIHPPTKKKAADSKRAQWRKLFGSIDYCECEHCRSVHGPAAYLADLLAFLGGTEKNADKRKAYTELSERRPDLQYLELSCINTNTVLPYIDLAIEVLEDTLAPPTSTKGYARQTTGRAEDLAALPGHQSAEAYKALRDMVYPWRLPFDLQRAEVQILFSHLGFERHTWRRRISRYLQGSNLTNASLTAACDQLELCDTELKLLNGKSDELNFMEVDPEFRLWGYQWQDGWTDDVRKLAVFRRRASFDVPGTNLDLRSVEFLVNSTYIDEKLEIEYDTEAPCDLSRAKIESVPGTLTGDADWKPVLARMRRFLRLQHTLGWTVDELDKALISVGAKEVNDEAIVELAVAETLRAELDVPLVELLSWWSPIDHAIDSSTQDASRKVLSLYERLFLSPTIPKASRKLFALNRVTDTVSAGDPITGGVAAAVAGALQLSLADLERLLDYLGSALALKLDVLSPLHRMASVARALDLSIERLLHAIGLTGTDLFSRKPASTPTPQRMEAWIRRVQAVQRSSLTLAELDYLLRHQYRPDEAVAPTDASLAHSMFDLQASLSQPTTDTKAKASKTQKTSKAQLVVEHVADDLPVSADVARTLLGTLLDGSSKGTTLADDLLVAETGGLWASYHDNTNLSGTPTTQRIETRVELSSMSGLPGYANLSARFEGVLLAPKTGTYTITVSTDASNVELRVGGHEVKAKTLDLMLRSGEVYDFVVELTGSTPTEVRILWQPPGASGNAVVPTKQLLPSVLLRGYRLLHKAATLIGGLGLDAAELLYIDDNKSDFRGLEGTGAGFDLSSLPLEPMKKASLLPAWEQLCELVAFRKRFPRAKVRLIDVLAAGSVSVPKARALLAEMTGWKPDEIARLTGSEFLALSAGATGDWATGRKLNELEVSFTQMKQLGIDAKTLVSWTTDAIDNDLATSVRRSVQAKYGPTKWKSVYAPLRDVLRRQQRDALVAAVVDADDDLEIMDDLLDRLLIDVGVEPCMKTSRLKLALSSVQLFIQRCLSGDSKFPRMSKGQGKQWAWRKNYRVWEANRKVFLYPENWIEPELRDDKTPLFEELESELLENELTDANVEKAYARYLEKLLKLARLEIIGAYEDRSQAGKVVVHLFGRTPAKPHEYYYRTLTHHPASSKIAAPEWTPWEAIDIDISGDHILPVVWNRQLHVFWPAMEEAIDQYKNRCLELKIRWTKRTVDGWIPSKETGPRKFHWATTYDLPPHLNNYVKKKDLYVAPNLAELSNSIRLCADTLKKTNLAIVQCFHELKRFKHITSHIDANDNVHRVTVELERDNPIKVQEFTQAHFSGCPGSGFLLGAGKLKTKPELPKNFVMSAQILRPANPNTDVPLGFNSTKIITLKKDTYDLLPLHQHYHNWFYTPFIVQNRVTRRSFYAAFSWLGYEFHSLHHPYVCEFYENLIRKGLDGLLAPHPTFQPAYRRRKQRLFVTANSKWFENEFSPDKLQTNPDKYPVEDIDFEYDKSFAVYNWELFFHIPMLIAERLRHDQKFEKAVRWYHYIFNPTYVPPKQAKNKYEAYPHHYWQTRPLAKHEPETLTAMMKRLSAGDAALERVVELWKRNPFKPHLIARHRNEAYMKNVVMRYIDNLVEWGDHLFRRDSIESINEATHLYVRAAHLLGPKPEAVPEQRRTAKTFAEIATKLDPFSNFLIKSENSLKQLWPVITQTGPWLGGTLAKTGSSSSPAPGLVFYSESNDTFIPIDHKIPYQPPTARVIDLSQEGSDEPVVVSLGYPPVPSTFYFCIPPNSILLAYWDTIADRLFKIRNCMNIKGIKRTLPLFQPPIDPALLVRAAAAGVDLSTAVTGQAATVPPYRFGVVLGKARQLCSEVRSFGGALLSALEKRDAEILAQLRARHETKLLEASNEVRRKQTKEAEETVSAVEKQIEAADQRMKYYLDLVENDLLPGEQNQLDMLEEADEDEQISKQLYEAASWAAGIPTIYGKVPPVMFPDFKLGGEIISSILRGIADKMARIAAGHSYEANRSGITAGQERRRQEWRQQATQAENEIAHLQKTMAAAELRKEIADLERRNHRKQLAHAKESERFLRSKFTDKQLYGWMVSQLSALHFQCYRLAFDLAKRAERAMQHELGLEKTSYIQFGHWDSLKKGLLAGEKLSFDLERMEAAYYEKNTRTLELTKNISLARLNPVALVKLRESGECYVHLPEAIFDMDYPTHYMRRIKSVALTIPCVAGPYTTVACTMSLESSRVRKTATGKLEKAPWEANVNAIATSSAQNDAGLFELNFRDERFLPFEGAGVVSQWKLELPTAVKQFDYRSISDVVLHIRYTALDGRKPTKDILANLKGMEVEKFDELDSTKKTTTGLLHMMSARHEFPVEWSSFLDSSTTHALGIELAKGLFPHAFHDKKISISTVQLVLAADGTGDVKAKINGTDVTLVHDGSTTSSWGSARQGSAQGLNLKTGDVLKVTIDDSEVKGLKLHDVIVVLHYTASKGS